MSASAKKEPRLHGQGQGEEQETGSLHLDATMELCSKKELSRWAEGLKAVMIDFPCYVVGEGREMIVSLCCKSAFNCF